MLALLLNRYRKGSNVFKLALYVPLLAPAVLVGLIWQFMTNFDFGFINLALQALGFDRLNILGSGTLALGTIVLAEVWRGLGFWTLYFLASLQNIPEELLDAARVDGAKGVQRFRRVTIPLLRPMLLFAVVIAIIANFQVFDTVYVLTQGGPHESTSTLVWFIWKRLFQFQETGQGYAAAVLLLGDHPHPDGDLVLAARGAASRAGGLWPRHGATVEEPATVGVRRGVLARRSPQPGPPLRQGVRGVRGLVVFAVIAVGPFIYLLSPSLPAELRALQLPAASGSRHSFYTGQLRHDPERHELPALGAQHPDLRDVGYRDHAGHRHAGRLCLRAASLSRQDRALRARARRR